MIVAVLTKHKLQITSDTELMPYILNDNSFVILQKIATEKYSDLFYVLETYFL